MLLGGVTERYVWTLVGSGALKSFKVGHRRMVTRESIDEFIAGLVEDDERARAAAVA